MKTRLLAVLAAALISANAFAAGPVSFGVQATGGNINVEGLLKDVYGFGIGGGAHLDINLPVLFGIRIQADYVSYSPDNAKYQALLASLIPATAASDFSIDGGTIRIISIHANGKFSFLPLPIVSPYLTGGAGFANLGVSDATVKYQGNPMQGGTFPGAKGETNGSANLGVGVDLNLVAVTLFLEARYAWIFTSGGSSTYIPISLGITF